MHQNSVWCLKMVQAKTVDAFFIGIKKGTHHFNSTNVNVTDVCWSGSFTVDWHSPVQTQLHSVMNVDIYEPNLSMFEWFCEMLMKENSQRTNICILWCVIHLRHQHSSDVVLFSFFFTISRAVGRRECFLESLSKQPFIGGKTAPPQGGLDTASIFISSLTGLCSQLVVKCDFPTQRERSCGTFLRLEESLSLWRT